MPGDVKFEARVAPLVLALPPPPFDSRILTSISHKRRVFGRFFGFVLAFLHSKTSSFLAFQNAKSFVCTRSVGSFRKNNIFLPFPRLFPPCRVPFAFPCRRLPALSFDNSNRLPRVGGRVKRNVQETKRQVTSVRGRVTGAGESKDIYDPLHQPEHIRFPGSRRGPGQSWKRSGRTGGVTSLTRTSHPTIQ